MITFKTKFAGNVYLLDLSTYLLDLDCLFIGFRVLPVNTRNNALFHIASKKLNFVVRSPINRILNYSNEHLSKIDFFCDNRF